MSRAAFAQALGTHSDKIKNVETGKQRVDHEILAALRQVFAVDLDELVSGGSGNGQSLPNPTPISTEFVPVAHFTAQASAGHGSLVQDEVHDSTYAYSRAFLTRRGLKPENLAVLTVRGESMIPDLHDKDKILINCVLTEFGDIEDGAIYAVTVDGSLYVKRIQRLPGQRLMLVSSNPAYQPITVEGADMGSVRIIGPVITSSREW